MTHAFLKKALTFIGAAALVVPLAMGLNGQNVSADDAPTDSPTQKVTLTKYASQAYAENQSEQTDPTKAPDLYGKQTLEGAEFQIYDVTTKYWESDNRGDEAKIATDIQDASWYKEDKPTKTGTTDVNGQFTVDLPIQSDVEVKDDKGDKVGIFPKPAVYLFVESKTPNGFKQSVNFIVALPRVKVDNGKTSYPELYVYPKDAMPKQPDGKNYLKFKKVDKYNPETFLAGAKFMITRVEAKGEDGKTDTLYASYGGKTSVTGYQTYSKAAPVIWMKNKDRATTFISDSKDGTFGFEAASETRITDPALALMGLRNPNADDGVTYSYVETEAPKGYENDHGDTNNKQYEVHGKIVEDSKVVDGDDPIQITDTPKTILPHTGGIGIVLYVALGAALVALGTVAYKKRRAN